MAKEFKFDSGLEILGGSELLDEESSVCVLMEEGEAMFSVLGKMKF